MSSISSHRKSSISIDLPGFLPVALFAEHSALLSRDMPSRNVYCVYQRELPALTVHAAWHSSMLIAVNATWLHFRSLRSRCSPALRGEMSNIAVRFAGGERRPNRTTKVKRIRSALKTPMEDFSFEASCFVRDSVNSIEINVKHAESSPRNYDHAMLQEFLLRCLNVHPCFNFMLCTQQPFRIFSLVSWINSPVFVAELYISIMSVIKRSDKIVATIPVARFREEDLSIRLGR